MVKKNNLWPRYCFLIRIIHYTPTTLIRIRFGIYFHDSWENITKNIILNHSNLCRFICNVNADYLVMGNTRSLMAKVVEFDFEESEFKLTSSYYVHFRINILEKGMNLLFLQLWLRMYQYCSIMNVNDIKQRN